MNVRVKSLSLLALLSGLASPLLAANYVLIGWSDLGIHENDGSDFSVYSLMPPYSTIHAQFIVNGMLVTNNAGYAVTYEAVADASGSINRTSQGKGNFYQFAQSLLGVPLGPDQGLTGCFMPGPSNVPQPMTFDPAHNLFSAEGIPLLPYDDQGRKNNYPLFKLVARDTNNSVLASTQIVLPVTDEMDCRSCHGSGTQVLARPQTGWPWAADPVVDYKLNALQYHDDHHNGSVNYSNVLIQAGYNTGGLVATVTNDHHPVLCVRCHPSNALPGTGLPGMRPLTTVMHTLHGSPPDPVTGVPLAAVTNSYACLRCHAGPESLRVRGAHHNGANPDGTLTLQCQNCHGTMGSLVAPGRQGWLDEPKCQSCHTGTAMSNNGQLRFTSAFDSTGAVRQAVNLTFATQTNAPAPGFALFRASYGHGGLTCEACHNSTHAELPSLQPNDEVQSIALQGHAGMLLDCSTCHTNPVSGTNGLYLGGPHGMHAASSSWSGGTHANESHSSCRDCHGADYRGTVFSQVLANRNFGPGAGHYWAGYTTGCYNCHAGPGGTDIPYTNVPPVVQGFSTNTVAGTPVAILLQATDTNGDSINFNFLSQPKNGTAYLVGNLLTYFPADGFVGTDSLTFAAWDNSANSRLATGTIAVVSGPCLLSVQTMVPTAAFPNSTVPFRAAATLTQCNSPITYDWDFGDGSAHASGTNLTHVYPAPADYAWTLITTAGGVSQTNSDVLTISPTLGPPLTISLTLWPYVMTMSWMPDHVPITVETSYDLNEYYWQPVWDAPYVDPITGTLNLDEYEIFPQQYFRLRRVP
jgi:hypothetical protein